MQFKRSIIVPIVSILSGILFQLQSLNIFGNSVPANIITKLWPVLLIAAALDLLISQRRMIASVIMAFVAFTLLSTEFSAGWSRDLWQLFLKIWPALLILFGVDCIFSGRSLINAAVIIIAVIIVIYILLTVFNVPILKDLNLPDLSSIIPTSSYGGPVPSQPRQTQQAPDMSGGQMSSPILTGPGGQIAIAMPSQNQAQLNLTAASGKISLKAGATPNRFLSGTVTLDNKEKFLPNAILSSGQTAVYTLKSEGAASAPNSSNWDLALTSQRRMALNAVLYSGYFKADLRGLNISSANIENKYGPIDIMAPQYSSGRIRIIAGSGDIRVYIPNNTLIRCVITGTDQVEYPQRAYTYNSGVLSPRNTLQTPIEVEIYSNNGQIRIIESE